jgi:hypothetical protein
VVLCPCSKPLSKDRNLAWTLRIKTQAGGAVDSGTRTLVLADIQMILETVLVPDSDFAELKRNWNKHHWIASACAVNEPNPVTLTATGERQKIQLPQLRGLPVTAIYSFIHQSRNIAASAPSSSLQIQNSTNFNATTEAQDKWLIPSSSNQFL